MNPEDMVGSIPLKEPDVENDVHLHIVQDLLELLDTVPPTTLHCTEPAGAVGHCPSSPPH